MHRFIALLLLVALAACSPATPAPVTAQQVVDKLNAAGLGLTDVHPEARPANSPMPGSYTERLVFTLPEVAPRGGQILVCDTKQNCAALYAYFDMLKGLAGPYLYQLPSGLVVVQLNSGLAPATGAKVETVIKGLP